MNYEESLKDMDNLINIYKQCPHLSLKDSKAVAYTLEKTSRIVSAILKLASFIDNASNVRKDIEKTAIGLIGDAAAFTHSDKARRSFEIGVAKLTALLTTASSVGFISSQNTQILNNELSALLMTTATMGTLSGRAYIETDALSVEHPQDLFMGESRSTTSTFKSHQIDTPRPFRATPTGTVSNRPYQTPTPGEAPREARYVERIQEVQKDRRATILGLLQRKDRINVKDVANIVRDCSEKTIQRELAALVAQGVLKKEGERRWSTYRLV